MAGRLDVAAPLSVRNGGIVRPSDVEALLERYEELDARGRSLDRPVRRRGRGSRFEPLALRAAVQRADIDRALAALRQYDQALYETVALVHLFPWATEYADRRWRLRHSLTTRRQLAAMDLGCSYGTVYHRCHQAYRFLAPLLSSDSPLSDHHSSGA